MTHAKLMMASLAATLVVLAAAPVEAANERDNDLSAQRRPRIVIHPNRPLGPNAKRECQAWLEKEYRVSGTVIVPRQRCWWQ